MTYIYHVDVDAVISDLSRLNIEVETDCHKVRSVLRNVLQQNIGQSEAARLFPYVVKLLAGSDIVVKKLVCWFITGHEHKEDLLVLAVNTLMRDCKDPNPVIRGLALKTLTQLPKNFLAQYGVSFVTQALKDRSAHVRRIAVLGCLKVHSINSELIREDGVIDELYNMLRDQDPIVVTNCLIVLDGILVNEGGMVVNRQIAYHLFNRLTGMTEWGLVCALKFLNKYRPKTEDEAIDVMNIVDIYLKHSNSAVVVEALHFFLGLVASRPHLKSEIFKRAKPQILQFLGSGNHELVYLLLKFISSLLPDNREAFMAEYRHFFCKYNEPLYMKELKVELLPSLTCPGNIKEVRRN